MKIGLNATCFSDRPSGAKQRFIGIYTELFKLMSNDKFVVYEPSDCQIHKWFDSSPNVRFKKTPLSSLSRIKKYTLGHMFWPRTLKSENFDLFESFHLPLVKAPSGRTILTIHDIRGIVLGESWLARNIYRLALEKSLAAADLLITVSDSVRNEILDLYPETEVDVIYNGTNVDRFENIQEELAAEVQLRLNLPSGYLLAVGHFEERKNYLNLVEAVYKLHQNGRFVHLVIVGNDSGELEKIRERTQHLKISGYVHFFHGLTDAEVGAIYANSSLFVFSSSYEGFGIPILEAMAAKCPMVISDIPVFKEITQGKSVYCSPLDPDSIAAAIEGVMSSAQECERLIKYGSQRVQDFSFQSIAVDVRRIYKSLV